MSTDTEKLWWKKAVIYELYIDKFAGDLRNLPDKIPYLSGLGVDCIHLLPHYKSPMVDDGYDVSDYLSVRENLGTLDEFDLFAGAAESAGIKIMVDLVLNHTSTAHPWFLEAVKNPKSKERGYYIWSATGGELQGSTNCFPELKPSNWIYSKEAGLYYFSTFYPEQADLNWDNPEIFSEICKIIDFWVLHGVSAFRFDAVSHLVKKEGTASKSLPETHAIIKKIRKYIGGRYPDIAILGEVHDTMDRMLEYFGGGGGDECQLLYHFPLAEVLAEKAVLGKSSELRDFIKNIGNVPENASWVGFARNHDELSLLTLKEETKEKIYDILDPRRRLRFASGISVGLKDICKARGAGEGACFKEIFETLLGLPSAVMIYYGDELGAGRLSADPANKDTRVIVRGQFDWAEAEKQSADPDSLLCHVKNLILKRKQA